MIFGKDQPAHTRLKLLRVEKGLSQAEAADQIGCTQKTIWLWEVGKVEASPRMRERIAAVYGVDAKKIWGGSS
jgi:DNA-binding XRE family transcriptional regulator